MKIASRLSDAHKASLRKFLSTFLQATIMYQLFYNTKCLYDMGEQYLSLDMFIY